LVDCTHLPIQKYFCISYVTEFNDRRPINYWTPY
jgi:hypothetical protein